jgi:hypothetical protein
MSEIKAPGSLAPCSLLLALCELVRWSGDVRQRQFRGSGYVFRIRPETRNPRRETATARH